VVDHCDQGMKMMTMMTVGDLQPVEIPLLLIVFYLVSWFHKGRMVITFSKAFISGHLPEKFIDLKLDI